MHANQDSNITYDTRSELERRIIQSSVFKKAIVFGKLRKGHPEKTIGQHIKDILNYLEEHFIEDREKLRIIAFLHDLGKPFVEYSEKNHIIGESHAVISERIARQFISDEELLKIIRYHDKYHSYYKRYKRKGRYNKEKFQDIFSKLDIQLLLKFMYADNNHRRKNTSLEWFITQCENLDLPSRVRVKYKVNTGLYGSESKDVICDLDTLKRKIQHGVEHTTFHTIYGIFGIGGFFGYQEGLIKQLEAYKKAVVEQNPFLNKEEKIFLKNLKLLIDEIKKPSEDKCPDLDKAYSEEGIKKGFYSPKLDEYAFRVAKNIAEKLQPIASNALENLQKISQRFYTKGPCKCEVPLDLIKDPDI